jgi:hypothetical protein
MKISISGTQFSDEVSQLAGRFILNFGYCEFLLLTYYNEIHDDPEKALALLELPLKKRVGKLKGELERLKITTDERKRILDMLDRFDALAISRNLVCHNPYMTMVGRQGEGNCGAIFGVRSAIKETGGAVAVADISDLRRFEQDAARLFVEFHQFFPVLQSGLHPKH